MQMLNFGKIPTLLLLLQLISINTQNNNSYTVIKISVYSSRWNNYVENGDGNRRPVYHYDNAGKKTKQIFYCQTILELPKDLLSPKPHATGCTDIHFEPYTDPFGYSGLLGYSELQFVYSEVVKVQAKKLGEALENKIEKKQDMEQMYHNFIQLVNLSISVQTITPDVPLSKPGTVLPPATTNQNSNKLSNNLTPSIHVENGRTDLEINFEVARMIESRAKINTNTFRDYVRRNAGGFEENQFYCPLYVDFVMMYIPKFLGPHGCICDTNLKVEENFLRITVTEKFQLIYEYPNKQNIDEITLTETLKAVMNFWDFRSLMVENFILTVNFTVSVQHK